MKVLDVKWIDQRFGIAEQKSPVAWPALTRAPFPAFVSVSKSEV